MPVIEEKNVRKASANCTITSKRDPSVSIKTVQWHGKKDMKVGTKNKPVVTDPSDVILKVTSAAICGSDLHLYLNYIPGMEKGDVMGHEFMGIVEEVGPAVSKFRPGDRAVAAFDIGCDSCTYCQKQLYSACDNTNDSKAQEDLYGHKTSGIYGYSHMTGGWDGGQAQYVRVPFADTNLYKLPHGKPDLKYLFLSDILPTGWHASELGQVSEGQTVAIWGCGPVGMLAALSCHVKKAARIILIDREQYRLDFAKKHMSYVETINVSTTPAPKQLKSICPQGPDVAIETAGMHYTTSIVSTVQLAVGLQTDPSDILNEMITSVRKGGILSIIGVYGGTTNAFNIGAFMEKGLRMAAGQTPTQKYWDVLMRYIESGEMDPSFVVTHEAGIDEAPKMYQLFNEKTDGCIKVVLHPN